MRLHQRGIDMLLNLEDAIDHFDRLTATEVQTLLKEVETVLRDLLARDMPEPDSK